MTAIALHLFTIEDRLRGALARNELSLLYQPQFDVRTASISGMEVLLRWTSAELGVVSSAEFLPVAEETGLILPIGDRKSTRLNSSHDQISYAVFCLKKKTVDVPTSATSRKR